MNLKILEKRDLKSLAGYCLVAMPQLQDNRFSQAVIYICGHDQSGAMGIVINKMIDSLYMKDLLMQLELPVDECIYNGPIHFGGPVEMGRGFVLHSADYQHRHTLLVTPHIALTANMDILKLIGKNEGPKHHLIALGYAGWSPKQLDAELHDNSWLIIEPDESLLYQSDVRQIWRRSIKKIGVNPDCLSGEAGHA